MPVFKRIVAAIDGSPASTAGLRKAIELAADQRAVLRLISVVHKSFKDIDSEFANTHELLAELRESARQLLDDAAARARKARVEVETNLLEAAHSKGITQAILKEAEEWHADLIVLGTHGRSAVGRLLLGSVAEAVVRRASQPVLLLRGAD